MNSGCDPHDFVLAHDFRHTSRNWFQPLAALIPNVYPRFVVADKPFDLNKQLKALLNPAR
jgi:hypothetical protein